MLLWKRCGEKYSGWQSPTHVWLPSELSITKIFLSVKVLKNASSLLDSVLATILHKIKQLWSFSTTSLCNSCHCLLWRQHSKTEVKADQSNPSCIFHANKKTILFSFCIFLSCSFEIFWCIDDSLSMEDTSVVQDFEKLEVWAITKPHEIQQGKMPDSTPGMGLPWMYGHTGE